MPQVIVSRIRDWRAKLLQLEDITAGYGDAPLFSGLSLCVACGEMRLIQGASGCGKSTLLGIICGTADAALSWSGDVRLNDQSISALPAEDRRVGLIFQDALLFPHMTVGDNLAFGLAARHRRNRDTAVADALGVVGLEGLGERDPATLSGGQAARVALMRTLLAEPGALLMDEAFSALDPERRHAFGGFVREQVRIRKIPALLVSHDAGDAAFADGKPVRLG